MIKGYKNYRGVCTKSSQIITKIIDTEWENQLHQQGADSIVLKVDGKTEYL